MTQTPESVREGGVPTAREEHELECLRHQVKQSEYPCSPHCAGYLRELEIRNTHQSAIDQAIANERKAIVEWLRREAGYSDAVAKDEQDFLHRRARAELVAFVKNQCADIIERGEHTTPGETE